MKTFRFIKHFLSDLRALIVNTNGFISSLHAEVEQRFEIGEMRKRLIILQTRLAQHRINNLPKEKEYGISDADVQRMHNEEREKLIKVADQEKFKHVASHIIERVDDIFKKTHINEKPSAKCRSRKR